MWEKKKFTYEFELLNFLLKLLCNAARSFHQDHHMEPVKKNKNLLQLNKQKIKNKKKNEKLNLPLLMEYEVGDT